LQGQRIADEQLVLNIMLITVAQTTGKKVRNILPQKNKMNNKFKTKRESYFCS
jgi:hypothetical protein